MNRCATAFLGIVPVELWVLFLLMCDFNSFISVPYSGTPSPIKVRVVCARAHHTLFMNNMLIRPTEEELKEFGEPDLIIYNAGQFPANRLITGNVWSLAGVPSLAEIAIPIQCK